MGKILMPGLLLIAVGIARLPLIAQQDKNIPPVPARATVTVEAKHNGEPPALTQQDIQAFEEKTRVPVDEWLPLQGTNAGLQLLILLDDGSGSSLSTQLDEIRSFILGQPKLTEVGVGYMQN